MAPHRRSEPDSCEAAKNMSIRCSATLKANVANKTWTLRRLSRKSTAPPTANPTMAATKAERV